MSHTPQTHPMDQDNEQHLIRKRQRKMANDSPHRHAKQPTWFNFADGDVVLRVIPEPSTSGHVTREPTTTFKVHRKKLLSNSQVFADMFCGEEHLPANIDRDETGCPVVDVFDSVMDWKAMLAWLYYPAEHYTNFPVSFELLGGAVRLSHKYDVEDLRDWCVQELCRRWPVDVANMSYESMPHAAEAIMLADQYSIPEILPAAFYALSVQKWACGAEGGQSHRALSKEALRLFIAGRESLNDILMSILIDPLHDAANFAICEACAPQVITFWRERLRPNPASPYSCFLLRELKQMALPGGQGGGFAQDSFLSSLCIECAFRHSTLAWNRMFQLRESIPKFFKLG